MQVNLTPNEIWKILDAIKSYSKDYSVAVSVQKTFDILEKKLKTALESSKE
jgi:hypothetical protein